MPSVKGIQVKQHIVEGDYVATVFDMETVTGVDHVFDRIHIVSTARSGEYTRFTILTRSPNSSVVVRKFDRQYAVDRSLSACVSHRLYLG
jgi:hypothetical protein